MILKIKRSELDKLTGENIYGMSEYYALDQAADKIRAIYNLFGWNLANRDQFETLDLLMGLVDSCAKHMINNKKSISSSCSTGGMTVELIDGEMGLELTVDFKIIM